MAVKRATNPITAADFPASDFSVVILVVIANRRQNIVVMVVAVLVLVVLVVESVAFRSECRQWEIFVSMAVEWFL